MPYSDTVGFRCKNCGHLEAPEHAGEFDVPLACSVCGHGVTLHPKTKAFAAELCSPETTAERRTAIAAELLALSKTGDNAKTVQKDNWEVLATATDARLAELGLERHKVVEWIGKKSQVANGKTIAVELTDGSGAAHGAVGNKV